ncbi:hypothetical protein EC957_004556 [Mortierella hygrophila]|uniref:Uncharacterized protein n=1 Tax=Mortierella hygrophila TaxID=979708 RepID=A0A9P6K704_9FUNG|nr:hypothetical protein EC957_004556 [Mortierella hygrophila]
MSSLDKIALGYLPVNSQGAVLDDLTRFCPNLRRTSFLGLEDRRMVMLLSQECIRRKYPHQNPHPYDGGGGGGGGGTEFELEGGELVSTTNATTVEGGLLELGILNQGIGALAKHSYWDEDEQELMRDRLGQSRDIIDAARIPTGLSTDQR